MFLLSTLYTIIVLPYYAFFKKEYILEIDDKEAGLKCAQWLVLYYLIDFFCLYTLPLLTYCAVFGFLMTEYVYEMRGTISN
jgi:hypothetical protein